MSHFLIDILYRSLRSVKQRYKKGEDCAPHKDKKVHEINSPCDMGQVTFKSKPRRVDKSINTAD